MAITRLRSWTYSVLAIFCPLSGISAQTVSEPIHSSNPLERLRAARRTLRSRRTGQSMMLGRVSGARILSPRASFDTSGDGTLNGAYFVRQLLTSLDSNTGAITRAVSLTGTMTFDGNGNFTFSGQELDSTQGNTASPYSISGTYVVSSSGLFQIQNPIDNTDTDFGGVGGSGEIVASATEGPYDDIFVAIPEGPASGLQGSYQVGLIDFLQGNASNVRDAYFTLAPDGNGNFGSVTVNGAMANQGSTNTQQTLSGVTYSFSGSNGTITFPTALDPAAALVSGAKRFAVSADRNILVGGSVSGFDLFVGIQSAFSATNSTFGGTYFVGALGNDTSGSCNAPNCIDSFYGSLASNGQGAGTEHLRYVGFTSPAFDFTNDISYQFPSSGIYNDGVVELLIGVNGEGLLQVGTGSYYTLILGFQAQQYSGTGVFLDPDGIVNAANFAPITNPVAPGEYVSLFGSGLAANAQASSLPLPAALGSAQVNVDGTSAPFLLASPTLLNILVPNETPANDVATFQVSANQQSSTPVALYTAGTAPGVFTSTANGIGPADVFHANYTYVTENSPAVPGETVFFYATGLGATTPPVADGAAAPSGSFAIVNDPKLSVDIYDSSGNTNPAKVAFAGLAAGLAAVYQINFTVPSGVAPGEGYLDVGTTDGYTSEAKIWVQAGAGSVSITLSPATATVKTGATQQFTATVTGAANSAVTWSVNNIAGGNATMGTISATGLYTAPASVPTPNIVTVMASTDGASATATVTISSPSGSRRLKWTVSGSVTSAVGSLSFGGTVTLPASGGSGSFTSSPATFTITVSGSNFSITGSGFGAGSGASCTGSASGGGSITSSATGFSAQGSLSGTLQCEFADGSTQNYTISGSFTVTASPLVAVQQFNLMTGTSGTGSGKISSSPGGTSCGSGCLSFAAGTVVTLTATPNSGSTFAGWSGACSGAGTCTVTMNSNQTVTAVFNLSSTSPPLKFTAPTLPPATIGMPYTFNFCSPPASPPSSPCGEEAGQQNPSGGVPPYHFQLQTGTFPPIGLVLDLNGTLAGTPDGNSGTYTFGVCAVDLAGSNVCPSVTLTVQPSGSETWTGTITGVQSTLGEDGYLCYPSYVSGFQGSWNLSFQISITIPGSLVAALQGIGADGSGTASGTQSVNVQVASNSNDCQIQTANLPPGDTSVSVFGYSPGALLGQISVQSLASSDNLDCFISGGAAAECVAQFYVTLVPNSVSSTMITGTLGMPGYYVNATGNFTLTKQ